MIPRAIPRLQSKRYDNPFSRFRTGDRRVSLYFVWAPLSPKIVPSHGGIWTPSKTWFLEPIRAHKANGISIGSAVFAQMTEKSVPILYNGTPLPPQNCPFPWGIWTPSNTWLPGPTQSSIRFSRLCRECDRPTDRPTDHATWSVTVDRI